MKEFGSIITISFTVLVLFLTISFAPRTIDAAPSGPRTDPSFTVALDQNLPEAYVEPGASTTSQVHGKIDCLPGTTVPGQKIVLILSTDGGEWASSISPEIMEFHRGFLSLSFIIEVVVTPGTSVRDTNKIRIDGHWTLDPGTKEGDMEPYLTSLKIMPYSDVNISVDGRRRSTTFGKDAEFKLTIRNLGNSMDHYQISIACEGDCLARIDETNITVMEDAMANVSISLVQNKGSPGSRTFSVHISGQYPGKQNTGSMILRLDSKIGPSMVFTEPWGAIIAGSFILITLVIAFFLGWFMIKKRRIP